MEKMGSTSADPYSLMTSDDTEEDEPASKRPCSELDKMVDMGFQRARAERALLAARGSVPRAIEMLSMAVDEHTAKAVRKPVRAGGWYWVHAGSLQPYTWHVQLELEAAYHRGDAELQISPNGLKYDVVFDRSAPPTLDRPTAKQRGYEKERDVFRVITSDELPLLSEARHTARLERAEDVLPYVAELKAAADALEAARRGVTATYEVWLAATAPLQLLREQSVALVGTAPDTTLIGRGRLHKLITDSGGNLPSEKAKEKVNRNTTILVLSAGTDGTLVSTSEAAAETALGAARKAASDENARRGAVVGAKRKELIAIYDEVGFVKSLTQGAASEGSFPWHVRSLATARSLKRQKHALLQLAMASAVWRLVEQRVPPPLHGLRVVMTGVMLLSNGDLSTDTHAEVRALVRRLGVLGLPGGGVTKSETDVLIVGRGEKGENGKPNGKGEAAESSAKYAAALKFNAEWSERHKKRAAEHASSCPDAAADGAAAGSAAATAATATAAATAAAATAAAAQCSTAGSVDRPPIAIVYEEDVWAFALSEGARELVRARAGRPQRLACPPREKTMPPMHKPDLRAIRYSSISQQAHGRGEPGVKGSVLADALAAPEGYSLMSALIAAQSVDPSFVWTMLQTASVSDGAPSKMQPSIILIDWVPDPTRRAHSDGQPWQPPIAADPILTPEEAGPSEYLLCASSAERPAGAAGLAAGLELQSGSIRPSLEMQSGSIWPSLEMQSGSIWLGSEMLEDRSRSGTLRLRDGGNTHLEAICACRQKPLIRHAYRVSADTTIEAGHGQMHSKFWLLHFASVHDDGREVVRLVVSSANAQAGAYGGMPGRRSLCGLWWADFVCSATDASPPPPSPLRTTLLHHVQGLLASKKRHGAGSLENRTAAERLWRETLRGALERADTSPADAAGTTLISHVPGTYPHAMATPGSPEAISLQASLRGCELLDAMSEVQPRSLPRCELPPMGLPALRECFHRALRHPSERLDCSVLAHCASGWSAGGDGAQRFSQWCEAAAPNGGHVTFHWPRRGDSSILGSARAAAPREGFHECRTPEWLIALPMVQLALRTDILPADNSGYQATPHLMLYVLHEPLPADGQPPAIRRLLLTSANLSAAPWGYVRSGEIEIRNFELGVCVAPEWPVELVEPLGSPKGPDQAGRSHRVWAQAIPFHLEQRAPCTDPYLGKGIGTRSDGRAEIGHLNY